ncbi:hypothetical protein BKA57DRAFT_316816 [Linnemannia elongata]|nr:hypothetical protein BKA57DRAFT_316816 [Linnemannia elongata]
MGYESKRMGVSMKGVRQNAFLLLSLLPLHLSYSSFLITFPPLFHFSTDTHQFFSHRRTFFSVILFLAHPHSQTYISTNKNNNSPSEPTGNHQKHLFSVSDIRPKSSSHQPTAARLTCHRGSRKKARKKA